MNQHMLTDEQRAIKWQTKYREINEYNLLYIKKKKQGLMFIDIYIHLPQSCNYISYWYIERLC